MHRVNELLRRAIGDSLFSVMHENDFDMSSVTITHVVTSPNLREARVLVSIRDHHEDRERMMSLLRRHRAEIQNQINRDLTLKYTPRLRFELDTSLERGDNMLALLDELEETNPHNELEEQNPHNP